MLDYTLECCNRTRYTNLCHSQVRFESFLATAFCLERCIKAQTHLRGAIANHGVQTTLKIKLEQSTTPDKHLHVVVRQRSSGVAQADPARDLPPLEQEGVVAS